MKYNNTSKLFIIKRSNTYAFKGHKSGKYFNKQTRMNIHIHVCIWKAHTHAVHIHTHTYMYIYTLVSNCLSLYAYVLFFLVFFIKYVWNFQNYRVKRQKTRKKEETRETMRKLCWYVSMPRVGVFLNVKNVKPTNNTSKGSVCCLFN